MANALLLYPNDADPKLLALLESEIKEVGYDLVQWDKLPPLADAHPARPWMVRLIQTIQDKDCLRIVVVMHNKLGEVNDNVIWELGLSIGFQAGIAHVVENRTRPIGKTLPVAMEFVLDRPDYPADLKQLDHVRIPCDAFEPAALPAAFLIKLREDLKPTHAEEAESLRKWFVESVSRQLRDHPNLAASIRGQLSGLLDIDAKTTSPIPGARLGLLREWCSEFISATDRCLEAGSRAFQSRFLHYATSHFEKVYGLLYAGEQASDAPRRLTIVVTGLTSVRESLRAIYASVTERTANETATQLQAFVDAVHFMPSSPEFDKLSQAVEPCLKEMSSLCGSLERWAENSRADVAGARVLTLLQMAVSIFSDSLTVESRAEALRRLADLFNWHHRFLDVLVECAKDAPVVTEDLLRATPAFGKSRVASTPALYHESIMKLTAAIARGRDASLSMPWAHNKFSEVLDRTRNNVFAAIPEQGEIDRVTALLGAVCRSIEAALDVPRGAPTNVVAAVANQIIQMLSDAAGESEEPAGSHLLADAFVRWCAVVHAQARGLPDANAGDFYETVNVICLDHCFRNPDLRQVAAAIDKMIAGIPTIAGQLFGELWLTVDVNHQSLSDAIRTLARSVYDLPDFASRIETCAAILKESKSRGDAFRDKVRLEERQKRAFLAVLYRIQVALVKSLSRRVWEGKDELLTRARALVKRVLELGNWYAIEVARPRAVGDIADDDARHVQVLLEDITSHARAPDFADSQKTLDLRKKLDQAISSLKIDSWPYQFDRHMPTAFWAFSASCFVAVAMWLMVSASVGWFLSTQNNFGRLPRDLGVGWVVLDYLHKYEWNDTFLLAAMIWLVAMFSSMGRHWRLDVDRGVAVRTIRWILFGILISTAAWIPTNLGRTLATESIEIGAGSFGLFFLVYLCLVWLPPAVNDGTWTFLRRVAWVLAVTTGFGAFAWTITMAAHRCNWDDTGVLVQTGMRMSMMLLLSSSLIGCIAIRTRARESQTPDAISEIVLTN